MPDLSYVSVPSQQPRRVQASTNFDPIESPIASEASPFPITATLQITTSITATAIELSPTPSATPTADPGAASTPTVSLTPSPSITPTITLTQPPTLEVTATPTLTGTLPTQTEEPDLSASLSLSLTLTADTSLVTPGGVVPISWAIEGWSETFASKEFELSVTTPAGFTPFGAEEMTYDTSSNAFVLPAKGESGLGIWQIPADKPGPYTLSASLILDGKVITTQSITLEETSLTRMPKEGGVAEGLDGRIKVIFPEKAVDEPLDVRIRPPVPANRPSYALSENPFEIVASSQASGLDVHQFTHPITITVAYTGVQDLSVFYYEPEEATWLPLYTVYDRTAGVLYAQSDHLSAFDTDVNEWQAAEMPTVSAAQVSAQTGAASYSYPIWTPPGPGGLQPSLSLTYNSQIVDGKIASISQASWVGMGWSLDAGYIERDMHDTMDDGSDDTFNLVLNGTHSLILRASDSKYYLSDDNFWKLDLTSDIWTVWDKEGNKYVFGKTDASRARYPRYNCPTQTNSTWRWMLAEVENKFGKKLTYTYFKESKLIDDPCNTGTDPADIAIYPSTITYPNNRYRVVFDLEDSPLRTDYKSEWWNNDDYRIFFSRYRLDRIWIQHKPSTSFVTVRTYDLYYESSGTLFPGYNWSAGGKTFALTKIQQIGANGSTLRPATTFSYSDAMHLSKVDNGYGGSVIFDYEDSPWADVDTFADNYSNLDACEGGWTGSVTCVNGYNTVNGSGSYDFKNFHPGGVYYLEVSLRNTDTQGNKTGTVKLQFGNDAQNNIILLMNNETIPAQTTVTRSTQITLDRYSSMLRWVVTTSGALRVVSFKLKLLPTRYRVSSREVKDTSVTPDQDYFYYYEYDEPATNDAAHSDAVAGENPSLSDLYVDAYAEYRGVAMSREIGPPGSDGSQRVTTTWYHQDDDLKGRPSVTAVGTQAIYDVFDTQDTSLWAYAPDSSTYHSILPTRGDMALRTLINTSVADWSVYTLRLSESITDDTAMMVAFRGKDEDETNRISYSLLAVHLGGGYGSSDYYRLGLRVNYDDTADALLSFGTTHLTTRLNVTIEEDAWYVLLLVMDNQHPNLLLWKREDPSDFALYEYDDTANNDIPDNTAYRFKHALAGRGQVWLDEYSEGKLYTLSMSEYLSSVQYPLYSEMDDWRDLAMLWTRTLTETVMTFEGDGSWAGVRTTYDYNQIDQNNLQYGNLTREMEAKWNGSAWEYYRAVKTEFFPYTSSTVYLTGLPARTGQYQCGASSCGFGESDLLSQGWSLYDGSMLYSNPPSVGKLTRERTLLYCINSNCAVTDNQRFSDTTYTYDAYGNRITETSYSGEGTYSSLPGSGIRTTNTCFGVANTPPGCTDDYYYTYAIWQKNALTHPTTTSYTGTLYPGSSHTGYALGVPTSQTDPNGAVTTATYDDFGRLLTVTRPGESGGATITIGYNDDDGAITLPFYTQATQRIDASTNYTIRKLYNGLGQLVESHVANAVLASGTKDIVVDYAYDNYGQVITQTVPLELAPWSGSGTAYRGPSFVDSPRNYTTTTYDLLGRISSVTAPDGTYSARYAYLDLETRAMDARGNTTRNLLDEWGRTLQVIPLNGDGDSNPIDPSVTYTYDHSDQLESVIRAGETISLTYDLAGRKTLMVDPDMGTWYYLYDALGNLLGQTDAKTQRTCLYYDLLNRVTGKHFRSDDYCPGAPIFDVSYTYDQGTNGVGRRISMSDASGSTAWTYDNRGRVTQESKVVTGSGTFVTQYGYNSADLVDWIKYPADNGSGIGEWVKFAYHPQMSVKSACTWNGSSCTYNYSPGIQYDAAGRVKLRKLGGTDAAPVLQSAYDYFDWHDLNGQGRLRYLQTGTPGNPTSLQDFRYFTGTDTPAYDAVGNVLRIEDWKAGSPQYQVFTYDNLNRLTTAYTDGGTNNEGDYASSGSPEQYHYSSSSGNLTSKAGVSYTYNAQVSGCTGGGRTIAHAVSAAGSNSYSYDCNGNTITRVIGAPTGNHIYHLSYDTDNRLTGVSGAVTASFVYDGDGKRVKGTAGGTTTVYIGDYFEWTGSTSTMVKYYYAGSIRIAMRTGTGSGTTGLKWLLGDHLTSTAYTAEGSSGAETGEVRYKPWGEDRFTQGTTLTSYRFTGQRFDSYINLYWFESRWYDDRLGRFISPDPIIPDAYNPLAYDRYQYVFSNPVKFVDSSGHRPEGACEFGCYTIPFDQHHYKNKARQDILFSRIFRGSGPHGKWTHEDWRFYSENRDRIWNGEISWKNPDPQDWEGFSIHVERLASHYGEGESEQFLRDFALVFGGISYDTPWGVAAYESLHGPTQPYIHEGNQGLDPDYLDSLGRRQNQSHHYAGIFFLGYFAGPQASLIIELGRDYDNLGDLRLGSVAAGHGYLFSFFMDPSIVPIAILSLLSSP